MPGATPHMLVNLGGGTAKDLELLAKSIIDRVHKETGAKLELVMDWSGRS